MRISVALASMAMGTLLWAASADLRAELDRTRKLPVELLGKAPALAKGPTLRTSVMSPNPADCSGHDERCLMVLTARTDVRYGVASCSVAVPFNILNVHQSKIRNKKIRVVFVVRNEDPLDGNVYRFRPGSGILIQPGYVVEAGTVQQSPNEASKDFALVGMDSADIRRYAWTSINNRKGLFPFEIYIQRHNADSDLWDDCDPKDPIIFNTD